MTWVWRGADLAILTGMELHHNPPPTPKDATKATEDQRELQDQLDHQDDDPEAPGRHTDRHGVADET